MDRGPHFVVIACDKREALAQGSASDVRQKWIASRRLSSGGASRRPVGSQYRFQLIMMTFNLEFPLISLHPSP
jgi:hypothetical protein